ncbi:MAG: DUF1311 domain-containing protein [Candidatus Melainabacteria bacterium]|nr:MAG: DUF1311 domain-containing protein [Candidatus Melainabacteria bacterium]
MNSRVATLICLSFLYVGQACAQTQLEMNEQANSSATLIKKRAQKTLRTLSTKYAKTAGFKTKMDEAQELYENFVQAHINERFPVPKGEDDRALYGSIEGSCVGNIKEEMYKARLDELNAWSQPLPKADLAALKAEYNKVDKTLNDVYVKVKSGSAAKGKTGPTFRKNLTDAEVAWIAFRNSDSDAFALSGGSELFKWRKMIELTKSRTGQLKEWLNGAEEGDVCSGSIPLKQ